MLSAVFLTVILGFVSVAFADYTIDVAPSAPDIGTAICAACTYTASGQTFITTSGDSFSGVDVAITEIGTGAGDILVEIYATAAGVPTGSALGGQTFSVTATTCTVNSFNFSTPVTLSNATQYAIVFTPTAGSGSDYYYTCQDDPSTYAGGVAVYTNGTWGSDANADNDTLLYFITPSEGGSEQPTATSTPLVMTEQEYLFSWGIILYLLSIPFWSRVFNVNV